MKTNRRNFIKKAGTLGMVSLVLPEYTLSQNLINQGKNPRPKVLFFDVNETLLDLQPVKSSITKILGGKPELATLWFTTMLQYSLVVSASNQYKDFGVIGVAVLLMVAKNNNIDITEEQAKKAVQPILSLHPYPEVAESLKLLKDNGYTLVSFTNSSNSAVQQQLKNAKIDSYFNEQISIEDFGKFKPDFSVYHWAARKMKTENKDCMLIAAHGWDVAGALWAGWRASFIHRPGQQLFPLAPEPEIDEANLLKITHVLINL